MKKVIYLILIVGIILLTNTITHNLTEKKLKEEISKSISDCYLKSNPTRDIVLSNEYNDNGLFLKISNNSECFNIEKISLSIISYSGNIRDTINVNINEKINSRYDATIKLDNFKIDSIISSTFELNKISF